MVGNRRASAAVPEAHCQFLNEATRDDAELQFNVQPSLLPYSVCLWRRPHTPRVNYIYILPGTLSQTKRRCTCRLHNCRYMLGIVIVMSSETLGIPNTGTWWW